MIIQHLKKKIPYTVLKMKWPIGGANMVNDFYIPCSLRNNSAIQRLLTIIYCRISNNFPLIFLVQYLPHLVQICLCPVLPPAPLIISMGYFLDSQHVMSFSSVATSMGTQLTLKRLMRSMSRFAPRRGKFGQFLTCACKQVGQILAKRFKPHFSLRNNCL